ncbi:MAG: DUF2207 domain-containing protein [Firmicutes bacterium]|nr:DUF2207 domain-containing protein [Bacillota bacterium]
MKRIKKIILLSILVGALIFPRVGKAKETPVIENFFTDITVLENGNINVKEFIALNGEYNGFERVIKFRNSLAPRFNGTEASFEGSDIYNGDAIRLTKVKEIDVPNGTLDFSIINQDGTFFSKVNSADNGDKRVYTQVSTLNGETYRLYNKSDGETLGFYLEYTVTNVAIKHSDVAEIGWNLMGNELANDIENYEARIHIPNNQNELRAWAHGPLNGNIELVSKEEIKITVKNLFGNTAFDTRFVFDLNVIPKSTKWSHVTALDKILSVEERRAEDANQRRQAYIQEQIITTTKALDKAEKSLRPSDVRNAEQELNILAPYTKEGEYSALLKRYQEIKKKSEDRQTLLNISFGGACIAYLLGMIYLVYRIYHKYDKEYSTQKIDYFRDIPNNYGPACVTYLMKKTTVNEDVSATLLNLISDKVITYEKIDKKNYKLVYHETEREFFEEESILIDWMFGSKKDGAETTLKEFQDSAKDSYTSFLNQYEDFKKAVLKHGRSLNFYEEKNVSGGAIFASLLGFVIGIIGFYFEIYFLIPIIFVIIAIATLIYFVQIRKRTMFGRVEYEKWSALKRFLKDFGNFETRDLPDMILWEKFLVYAYVFGCSKELEKTMKLKLNEMSELNQAAYGPDFFDIMVFTHVTNNLVTSSIGNAYATKATASGGNSSSAGGFGGGFSSGGGSFGGGGGGGSF